MFFLKILPLTVGNFFKQNVTNNEFTLLICYILWHKGQSSSVPLINIRSASLSRIWEEGNKWICLMRGWKDDTIEGERPFHFIHSYISRLPLAIRQNEEKECRLEAGRLICSLIERRTRWQSREFLPPFLYMYLFCFSSCIHSSNYQSSHRNLFVSLVCVVDTQVAQVFLARDFPRKGNLPLPSSHLRFQSRVSNVLYGCRSRWRNPLSGFSCWLCLDRLSAF